MAQPHFELRCSAWDEKEHPWLLQEIRGSCGLLDSCSRDAFGILWERDGVWGGLLSSWEQGGLLRSPLG